MTYSDLAEAGLVHVRDIDGFQRLVSARYRSGAGFFLAFGDSPRQATPEVDAFHIDFSGIKDIVEYVQSDLVVCVQTGITIDQLNERLAEFGQWFPVDSPGLLIDCIFSGDAGYLETGYGPMRSQVLGMKAIRGGGEVLECGGRVVKNVTGFDTAKLLVGSRGHLAWPVEAHLKLVARPRRVASLICRGASLVQLVAFSRKLLASGLPLMALEIIEDAPRQYCLIIQVGGPEAMVSDIVEQIRGGEAQIAVIENDQARGYLRVEQFPNVHNLELAGSVAYLEKLAEKIGPDLSIRMRPSCGRLYLTPSAESDLAEALENIRRLLPSSVGSLSQYETLNIAMVSGNSFRSLALGQAQPALSGLYARIKAQFDPLNCFSPQVSFQFESDGAVPNGVTRK